MAGSRSLFLNVTTGISRTSLVFVLEDSPERPFLWTAEHGWRTYGELDEIATRVASGFRRSGLRAGDRVMILLDNCEEYICAWFGTTRAGLIEVPANTDYFGSFLAHVFRTTTPSAL